MFYVSKEVFKYSQFKFLDSYVLETINYVIKPKLTKAWINIEDLLQNLIIIIAHANSTKENWKIFFDDDMKSFIYVEDLFKKFPKNSKLLLFCCNEGKYEIKNENINIIYPFDRTGVENLKFKVQWELFATLK